MKREPSLWETLQGIEPVSLWGVPLTVMAFTFGLHLGKLISMAL